MKKQKIVKVVAVLSIVTSILALNPIGVCAQWKHDSNGWWNSEGNGYSVGWRKIDGNWFYFGKDGYMVHDTTVDGYKIGSDGIWNKFSQDGSFTINQFVNVIQSKGYNLKVEDAEKEFLPVERKVIDIKKEQIYVYMYKTSEKMEKDALNITSNGSSYKSVSSDGATSNIIAGNWKSAPHFYKKGSIIVLYVGENEEIISDLNDIFIEQFAGDSKNSSN